MLQSETLTLFLSFLHISSSQSVYKKEGDDIILQPNSVTGPITNIMWKDGPNIAIQWEKSDGSNITYYRHFKGRASLNIYGGAMTIKGLTRNDSALYTLVINGSDVFSIHLSVISPVPVPYVTVSCDDEKISCILTCEGNTNGIDQLTYIWKFDHEKTISSKHNHIGKDNSSMVKEFSCELKNPVSSESSKAIGNPFTMARAVSINAGLTVLFCMLCPVLLLILIHRWMAGMWFFQKDHMPWEADFWRRHKKNCQVRKSSIEADPGN